MVFLLPTNMTLPLCQKSKDDLLPKNTPEDDISNNTKKDDTHSKKDIGILALHARKNSNDSLYLYGDLFRCFHILLSDEKARKLNL